MWHFAKQTILTEEGINTWEAFKIKFLVKYFLKDLRKHYVHKFIDLKQGSMSMENMLKFDELLKYFPYYQENDAAAIYSKFENKLWDDIKQVEGYLQITNFPTLVSKYRIYKDDNKAKQTLWKSRGP